MKMPKEIIKTLLRFGIKGAMSGYDSARCLYSKTKLSYVTIYYYTVRGDNGAVLCVLEKEREDGQWDLTDEYKKLKKKISASVTVDDY